MSETPPPDDPPPPGWAPPPPPPPPPPYPQPGYQQPYQPPGYQQPYQPYGYGYPYQAYPTAHTEGLAVAALVCAIASYVVCIPILAIVAFPLASSAKTKIQSSSGQLTGTGMVTASRWLAGINLVIWVGIIAVMVIAIVIDVSNGTTSDFDNFERFVR